MRGKARIIFSVPVLIFVVVLACGIVFIKSDFAASRVCSMLHAGIGQRFGLRAEIESCSIDLLPPALEAHRLRVQDLSGGSLLQAESVRIELDSLALLAGDFQVERVVVRKPQVHLRIVDSAFADLPGIRSEGGGEGTPKGALPTRIDIFDGRLDLVLDRWGLVQLRDLGLSLVSADDQMEIAVEVGGGGLDLAGGQGTSFPIQTCKCRANLDSRRVDLAICSLQIGEASIKASGRLDAAEGGLIPLLNFTVAGPLSMVHDFFPFVPNMQGRFVLNADTSPGEDGPRAIGVVDVEDFGILTVSDVDLQSRFQLTPRRLDLLQFRVVSPGGRVSGRAHLDLAEPLQFGGALTIEQADLYESLGMGGIRWRHIDLRGSGDAEFHGRFMGKGAPYVTVKSRLGLERLTVRAGPNGPTVFSLNGAAVQGEATFNKSRVRILSGRVEKGESVFEAEGRIRFRGLGVDAQVRSSRCELRDVSPIVGLAFEGGAGFEMDIKGTILDPEIATRLHVRDFGLEGHQIGYVNGRVELEDFLLRFDPLVLSRHGGTARLTGSLGTVPPHRLNAGVEIVRIKLPELVAAARGGRLPGFLGGLVGGNIAVSGTLDTPVLDFKLAFADLRLGGQFFEEAGVIGRYENGAWRLELLEASMGPGWIFAQGEISKDLDLNLVVYSTGLRAASFQALAEHTDLLDFRLDLHLGIKGPLRSPALDGWAKVYDTELGGRELADSSLTAKATSEHFRVDGKFFGDAARMQLEARLTEGLPFEGTLGFATEELGDFLPQVDGPARPFAALAGELDARGLLLSPGRMDAGLRLERAALHLAGLRLENLRPIELDLSKGIIEVRSCELGGTETRLVVKGGGGIETGPRLVAEGSVGLGLLPLLSGLFPRATGRANLALGASGSWSRPRLTGSLAFSADRIRVSFLPTDLESVTGQMQFTPRKVDITRMTGRFGGGGFTLWGDVHLRDLLPARMALTIELTKARYQASERLWGVGTGALSLTLEPGKRLRLAGQVRVHEGGFREHVSLVSFSNGLFRRRRPRIRTYDKKNELLDFDIRLLVPEKFQALYNLDLVRFQAEMKGELRLTGTNERLGLLGEMEALGGTVAYLSKEFAVDTARVQFAEEYGIEPRIEIQASRSETVDRGEDGEIDYLVSLGLLGEGDDFRVTLNSNPHLDEGDIVTLLSLGITSRDMDQLQSDNLFGLGGEILLRSLKADERLSKVFPFPPEVIQPKYLRMRSRFSDVSQTFTPRLETGVKLRFISDDLDLEYSTSLDDADQSLDLSYRLSKGVSTSLRWEDDAKTDLGDLGLDLKLDWEW